MYLLTNQPYVEPHESILWRYITVTDIMSRQHPMLLDWLDRAGHMYEPEDRGAWGDQARIVRYAER